VKPRPAGCRVMNVARQMTPAGATLAQMARTARSSQARAAEARIAGAALRRAGGGGQGRADRAHHPLAAGQAPSAETAVRPGDGHRPERDRTGPPAAHVHQHTGPAEDNSQTGHW
jgi:hypothetical protein